MHDEHVSFNEGIRVRSRGARHKLAMFERAASRAGCVELSMVYVVPTTPRCPARSFLRPAPCKGLRRAAHANGVVVLRSMLCCVLGSSVVVYTTWHVLSLVIHLVYRIEYRVYLV